MVIIAIVIIIAFLIVFGKRGKQTPEQKENTATFEREFNNPDLEKKFHAAIANKYDEQTLKKMINGQMSIGMTEEQFNESLEYLFYAGNSNEKNPYQFRQEEELKTKIKVIRRKRKRMFKGDQEFTFNNGVLVKIKTS